MMLILQILFLLSKAQNYMLLLSLYHQKIIKKDQTFLAKDLKDQCIEMNMKQKFRLKTRQMNIDIFSNQVGVNRLFALVYSNQDNNPKRLKSQKYY